MSESESDSLADLFNGGDDDRDRLSVGGTPNEVTVRSGDQQMTLDGKDAEQAALMMLRHVNGGSVLLEAYQVAQERGRQYGPPDENFEAAASLKGSYLGVDMESSDYAIEMILAKIARIQTGGIGRDHLVDIAGYARGAAVVEGINDERDYDEQ